MQPSHFKIYISEFETIVKKYIFYEWDWHYSKSNEAMDMLVLTFPKG